jgi:teichuronic acid biosynthesis glycosyltransferase TuaC
MEARHIVAIPSWYSDGRGAGGGYFRDQALALQAAGHRVAMLVPDICTWRDGRAGRAIAGEPGQVSVEDDGVAVYRRVRRVFTPRLPYRNALEWSHCGLGLFAAYVAANGVPDLVHAHSCLNGGVLAAAIRRRHGVPFIITEHSTGFAQNRLRWWERDLVRRVIRRADARIAVSPDLAGLLERQFPGLPWAYVPNILGDAFLAPPDPVPRKAVGPQPFVFLCAARLAPVKNHALLIAAFADAFAGDRDIRLHLAGDGPVEARLRSLCDEHGVTGQVEFLGALSSERLRLAMEAADAFVLASDAESFGVVVIEAQAAGLPVVSTASGGPDHLIDGSNGLLVPTGDRAALRDTLVTMRTLAGSYDRAQIRAAAIDRYGLDRFVRRFSEIAGWQLSQTAADGFSTPSSRLRGTPGNPPAHQETSLQR